MFGVYKSQLFDSNGIIGKAREILNGYEVVFFKDHSRVFLIKVPYEKTLRVFSLSEERVIDIVGSAFYREIDGQEFIEIKLSDGRGTAFIKLETSKQIKLKQIA